MTGEGGAAAPLDPDDVDQVTDAVLGASRLLVAVSARSIAAVEDQVTLPQFRMLVVLHGRGPMRAGALADLLAVHPSTATRMADRLDVTGMLVREGNPANRREVILRLTAAGADLVDEVTARRRVEISRIIAGMAPGLRSGLVDALEAFTAAGGEPPARPTTELSALGWT